MAQERETALANIAILACYEAYYGLIPRELMTMVHNGIKNVDYFQQPERTVKLAKAIAGMWMAQRAKTLDNTPSSLIEFGQRQSNGGSDKKDND